MAEARAAILAARAEQVHDGNAAGRRVFAELGYVKSLWDAQFRTTMVVDLDRDPEAMLARMHSKWRYNVRLAARKGVTVEEDRSPAACERLYEMFVRTAQRDGFMLRHKSYFDRAWGAMIAAGYAHIFFACHEGRPLAALLAYTFGQKVEYRVGASETEGRNLMPAHALQFHVMKWAHERGMSTYDLVAIPNADTPADASLWGLYWFKSGFGGHPVEWAGCLDKVLDPRGHAWEALEPAYYRLYKWRVKDVMY
jgi:lipid II:glycine glycyltransferase (peptidoglycan interpeptide bridge formation enzyme)